MYWIEVYFENGKTLRKESNNINDMYVVYSRYSDGNGKPRVQMIKSGYDDVHTGELNKVKHITT